MSQSWTVVCTLKETPPVVERFVDHHRALGCGEVFLFFSDPEDPALPWAAAQPGVRAEALIERREPGASGGFDRITQFGAYRSFEGKLVANANVALARSDADWIVHLDADEHLAVAPPVGDWLAGFDPDVWMVNLPPYEAVYRNWADALGGFDTDLFRVVLTPPEHAEAVCRELYGPLAPLFRRGLLGHIGGKSFTRRSAAAALDIHSATPKAPGGRVHRETEHAALLHYDALSFDRWKAKFRMRIEGEVVTAGSGGHRARQLEAFRAAQAEGGEGALRALFQSLLVLDGPRLERAIELGAATSRDRLP